MRGTLAGLLGGALFASLLMTAPVKALSDIGGRAAGAMSGASILTALLAVDGASSTLDADLLDGISSAAFAQLSAANIFDQVVRAPGFRIGGTNVGIWDGTSTGGIQCVGGSYECEMHAYQDASKTVVMDGVANAAGEVGVRVGSNATVALGAAAAILLAIGVDTDETPADVFQFTGGGHLKVAGTAPSYTTGTCTGETGSGDDLHGTVAGTCTAQTLIVTFGAVTAYATAPHCTVSAKNGALFTYATSTSALTITAATDFDGSFTCIE